MKKITKVCKMLLTLCLTTLFLGIGGLSANATETRDVWMQSIYKDNGVVTVDFKLNVYTQLYTDANAGYIYVKDMDTNEVTRYTAKKIGTEGTVDLYRATYTVSEGQNTRVKITAIKPSITGHEQEFVDDNNGNWYQA